MDIRSQITLRTKKLGVLIRDARIASRRTPQECADAIGITKGIFRAYEEGRKAPSLPELETLVYFLDLPIDHFWGKDARSEEESRVAPLDLPKLLAIRQRLIGALLRQERNKASISVKNLSHDTGISSSRIKAYELGERPIPLPELEALLGVLGARVETFFDRNGPIGKWMTSEETVQQFLDMPEEMRQFVCQAVNRPYVELAMKLSVMSTDKLRSVAEGLLDITF